MITYYAMYLNESTESDIIKDIKNVRNIGLVILLDLTFGTDEIRAFRDKLTLMHYDIRIAQMEDGDYNDLANQLLSICIEEDLRQKQELTQDMDGYFEVANLSGIYAGAMFSVANLIGGNIVYKDYKDNTKTTIFKRLPDVRRASLTSQRLLDILYEEGPTEYAPLSLKIYENRVAGMTEEEKRQFLAEHHNVYKVIDIAEKKCWIKYNKDNRTYFLTKEGLAARAMINKRDYDRANNED